MKKNITILGLYLFVAVLLFGACGTQPSEKNLSRKMIEIPPILYPEIPSENIVDRKKSDFPEGKIRSIEKIPLHEPMQVRELDVYKKGNYLLVKHLEMERGAYLLYVLSLPEHKIIARLAPFGEGPDEFTDIRIVETPEKDKLCYILDINRNKLYALTPDLKLEENSELLKIPGIARPGCLVTLYLGDNNYMTNQEGTPENTGIYTVNQKDSTLTGIIPFNFDPKTWSFFYYHSFTHNFQKNRGMAAFLYYDRVAFFGLDGSDPKMIKYGNTQLKDKRSPENPRYYISCFSNDRYVYACYQSSEKEFDETNPCYLEQYDWDGNPVARYKLPEGTAFYCGCATDDDSVLYMVDYWQDDFLHKVVLDSSSFR